MMVWGLKVPSMGFMTKILVIVFKSSSFCLLCCLFSGIQCWAFWLFDCNGWQRNKRKGKNQRGKSCWDKKIKKACQAKVGLRIWSGEGNWLQKCTHGKLMIFFLDRFCCCSSAGCSIIFYWTVVSVLFDLFWMMICLENRLKRFIHRFSCLKFLLFCVWDAMEIWWLGLQCLYVFIFANNFMSQGVWMNIPIKLANRLTIFWLLSPDV